MSLNPSPWGGGATTMRVEVGPRTTQGLVLTAGSTLYSRILDLSKPRVRTYFGSSRFSILEVYLTFKLSKIKLSKIGQKLK